MSSIYVTVVETVVYQAEVEVTPDLLAAAEKKGYAPAPDGVRRALLAGDLDEEVALPVVEDSENIANVDSRDVTDVVGPVPLEA